MLLFLQHMKIFSFLSELRKKKFSGIRGDVIRSINTGNRGWSFFVLLGTHTYTHTHGHRRTHEHTNTHMYEPTHGERKKK